MLRGVRHGVQFDKCFRGSEIYFIYASSGGLIDDEPVLSSYVPSVPSAALQPRDERPVPSGMSATALPFDPAI